MSALHSHVSFTEDQYKHIMNEINVCRSSMIHSPTDAEYFILFYLYFILYILSIHIL